MAFERDAGIFAREIPLDEYRDSVGREIGLSQWIEVDQARIDAFADVTMDWQYIHVDPVAAASSPFGGTVAHGFLTLSLLSAMAYDALPTIAGMTSGVNYGMNRLRFVRPVRSGSRVRGRFVLTAFVERSPGTYQSTFDVRVEIDGESAPAISAEWMTLTML